MLRISENRAERFMRSFLDVLRPVRKARDVISWINRHLGLLGLAAVGASLAQWHETLLPSNWLGKVFFFSVVVGSLALGVRAAYFVRTEVDKAFSREAVERRKQRRKIITAHVSILGNYQRYLTSRSEEALRDLKGDVTQAREAATQLMDAGIVNACSLALAGLDRSDNGPMVDLLDKLIKFAMHWSLFYQISMTTEELKASRAYFEDSNPALSDIVAEHLSDSSDT